MATSRSTGAEFGDRVALVTGAAGGVGTAVVRQLTERGVTRFALADVSAVKLDPFVSELADLGVEPLALPCDLAVVAECGRIVSETIARFGRIDIGIHTAAVAHAPIPFLETPDELWESEVALNLTAAFSLGRSLGACMRAEGGAIIYTASIASLGAGRGMAAYTATKAGMVGLVKAMAVELAQYRIRVNAISPGAIDTPRYRQRIPSEEVIAGFHEEFPPAPLNRIATADEIASAFAFLASDAASYITGHNLIVDGGTTAQVRTPAD